MDSTYDCGLWDMGYGLWIWDVRSAEVLNVAAGSMTIALPRKAVQYIPHFFRWLNANPQMVMPLLREHNDN